MGSCFRLKSKKNSYDVSQMGEYSPSGGTYQTKDQWGSKGKSRDKKSKSTNAGVIINQTVTVKEEIHDDVTTNQNYEAKENGVHTEDVKASTPSPQPSPKHVKEYMESSPHEGKHPGPEPSLPPSPKQGLKSYVPVVERFVSEDGPMDESDHESAVHIDHVAMEAVIVNESLQEPASPTGDIDIPEVFVESRHSYDSSEDDREDAIQVREEHLAHKEEEEGSVVSEDLIIPACHEDIREDVLITHEEHEFVVPEIHIQSDDSIANSEEDIQMSDSPAGTWDARLNKDVRAELDEDHQSPEGSKTNSTVSLETRDLEESGVKQARDLQRVQFDVPETDEEDSMVAGVSVISVTSATHEDPDCDVPYATSYESYEVGGDDSDRFDSVRDYYDMPEQMTGSDNDIVTSVEYTVATE